MKNNYLIIRSWKGGVIWSSRVETHLNPVDYLFDFWNDEDELEDMEENYKQEWIENYITFADGITQFGPTDDSENEVMIVVDLIKFVS